MSQKLTLDFDPVKIEPLIINKSNVGQTSAKIKQFDVLWESARDYMKSSLLNSMHLSVQTAMMKSVNYSTWTSMCDSMRTSMWAFIQSSMMDLLWLSMRYTMIHSIKETMTYSVSDSIWASMLASIMVKLSKDEYEGLIVDKPILEHLPYSKIRKISELYQWFTCRGLFLHRSMLSYEYLLSSWKDPQMITVINIRDGTLK